MIVRAFPAFPGQSPTVPTISLFLTFILLGYTHSNLKTPSCTAEDVANVILFFASDESRAITGQVIVTDFGAML